MEALNQEPGRESRSAAFDLVDLCYQMLSGWKLILCLALAGALVAGAVALWLVTPLYQATSILYVLSPDSVLNVSSLQLGTALTGDYIKVFDMWEVQEAVLRNLHLDYTYDELRDMVTITNTNGTRMLDISVVSPSPAEAAAIANEYARVASTYIQETMATDKPNLMSQALEPANPIRPNRARDVVIGFLAGGLLGAVITATRTVMDDKIKSGEDIRRYTGLPTLASVPLDEGNDEKGKRMGKNPKRGKA